MAYTNKGRFREISGTYRDGSTFYLALVTDTPTADTNTMADLTEIAAGNGYTAGGVALTGNSTDFPTVEEDDANDRARFVIRDVVWTASGGNLPASGNGALFAVLTDDNATPANREILHYWSLTSARTVSDGQTLTVSGCEGRAT